MSTKRIKSDRDAPDAGRAGSLVGGTPSTPGATVTSTAPLATNENPVVSDLGQSYIAASVDYAYYAVDRALPQAADEAERKYGLELYETKMMLEPTCAGMDRAVKILVLADGISVGASHSAPPRVGATAQQVDDYDKAAKMQEYLRAVVSRVEETSDDSLPETIWQMLDGTRLGHKLAEVTYDYLPSGRFAGKYGIERISPKPRENYAFVVDAMNRFRGVVAKVPGRSPLIWQGIIYDVSVLENAVAPEKLLVFTADKRNSDPRGRSWWRAVYDPYYRKQLAKPEEIKTLVQYGGGMITVIAPEINARVTVTDVDTGQPISMMQAIDKATSRLRSGHHATYPFGTIVNVERPSGDLQMFDTAFERYDREMLMAFLINPRSIQEARHGSKADTENAQDLLDELKMYLRERMCAMLDRLARRLVFLSFGPDWLPYAPRFTMRKSNRPDFAANATALGPLLTAIGPQTTNEQWDYFLTEVLGAPAGRVEAGSGSSPEEVPAVMAGGFR